MGAIFKKLFSKKKVIFWLAFSVLYLALVITANILANKFGSLINGVLGGERAIIEKSSYHRLYQPDFEDKKATLANGNSVTQEICEEGMVLLKNDKKDGNYALPLKPANEGDKIKVSIFGKNSVNLVYGGSGSAAPTQSVPCKTIYDSLNEELGFECNLALKEFYSDKKRSGDGRSENPDMEHGDSIPLLKTGETPIENYGADLTETYANYNDAALVVFSRIAGENWDLPRTAEDNLISRHYLELDNNERALLDHVCSFNFKHVIVLFNGSNNIDMAFLKFPSDPAYHEKIDGAMLIGSPGATGIMALGRILKGDVNPSGHLTDTIYTSYHEDPTWQNFGDNSSYKNYPDKDAMSETDFKKAIKALPYGDSYIQDGEGLKPYFMVAYEEGIYMGYRYYETRYAEMAKVDQAAADEWYNSHVLYPFGYGLSYVGQNEYGLNNFEQVVVNKAALEAADLTKDPFTVQVNVTNNGAVKGKQVVQIYASAPYKSGKIEKAHKVLVGFAKTDDLEPGATTAEPLEITITPYDFASFDTEDLNENGYKCYELDKGDYNFYVSENAHDDGIKFTKNTASDIIYENDPVTGTAIQQQFFKTKTEKEYLEKFLQQELSRSFLSTEDIINDPRFPRMPTVSDRTVDEKFILKEDRYTTDNPEDLGNMPLTNQPVTLKLEDMVGKDYDDPDWEVFLNQLKTSEMTDLFNKGMYATEKLPRVGVPKTLSCDGPTGLVAFMGTPEVYGTCYYCSECLVAQTYNVKLAEKQGNAIGNEALFGDQRSGGSHLPYTGWYSPGVNLHRSPFSGRNTEYYSEDPFISGKMAARVIEKSQEKGVYTTIKHFALNEQETHRSNNGQNYWVKEQAIRELYLKPFEIAIKEGKSLGLMSSFTRIGQRWCGGSYPLLTKILRNEWGFKGTVICDFHTDAYMDSKQMAYAGGDLNLTGTKYWSPNVNEPEDVNVLRRAAHNNLYALANSNAMNQKILGYKLPLWRELVYIGEAGVGVLFLAWGFLVIFMTLRNKGGKKAKKGGEEAVEGEVVNEEKAEATEQRIRKIKRRGNPLLFYYSVNYLLPSNGLKYCWIFSARISLSKYPTVSMTCSLVSMSTAT